MKIKYENSFYKDLKKIKDNKLKQQIMTTINDIKVLYSISEIRNIKKLIGYHDYYRIRISNYRIGIKLIDKNIISFIRIKHRKDIYKFFP